MISYWNNDEVLSYASVKFLQQFNICHEDVIGRLRLSDLLGPFYNSHLPYLKWVLRGTPMVFEQDISEHFNKLGLCIFTYYPEKKDKLLHGFYLQVFEKSAIILQGSDLKRDIDKFNSLLTNPDPLSHLYNEIPIIDLQIEKVIEYLKSILMSKFPGLPHIAEIHCMSVSKLKRDFKNTCGMSPFIYFRKLQMDLAEQYLKEKRYRVGEIAAIFNFSNPYNFTSCYNRFKKSIDYKHDLFS